MVKTLGNAIQHTKMCTHAMQITKTNPDFKLILNNEVIPQSHEIRYLGLTLDINLEWKTHITNTIKKANKSLGLIKRCLKVGDDKLKLIAFNTVVRPTMEYASQVWSPHTKTLIKQLDRVHKKSSEMDI